MKNQTAVQEHDLVAERLFQQQEAITLAEQALREQCQQMAELLKDLKNRPTGNHSHCLAELEVLRMGNDCLQQLVAQRDRELAELNQQLSATQQTAPRTVTNEPEVESLRQQLQEKDALIEELRASRVEAPVASLAGVSDRDYEAELTEYRRELEADRQRLNDEIQQLRARNTELDEAAREAELQLSRERAQLARERVQLDRMREEIRQELERAERDAGVRERLVAVDRLKGEMAERNRPSGNGTAISPASGERQAGSIWRNLLSS
jgi:predicted  nucleic acid-binding Zn-ribbon protein